MSFQFKTAFTFNRYGTLVKLRRRVEEFALFHKEQSLDQFGKKEVVVRNRREGIIIEMAEEDLGMREAVDLSSTENLSNPGNIDMMRETIKNEALTRMMLNQVDTGEIQKFFMTLIAVINENLDNWKESLTN